MAGKWKYLFAQRGSRKGFRFYAFVQTAERHENLGVTPADGVGDNEWTWVMRSTFKIELKMDMPQGDEETKDIMRQAMKEAAQTLLAQAVMISDRRPMIAVTSDNSFEGVENIDVSF